MRKLMIIVSLGIISLYAPKIFADAGLVAMQNAANEGKYLFVFIYKDQESKSIQLEKIFDQTMQKVGEQAKSIKIKVSDPAEKSFIDKFDLERSPMPFVLVLAPNGAIMGGFPGFSEEMLINSISSAGTANCIKALQDRKLVLLCLQNGQTLNNEAAMNCVNDFKADPRFGNATEIVMIDPSNPNEQKFLNQLNLNLNSKEATTVLIAPPAEIVGTYQGPITKDQLISDLQKASSGCCAGGCPGGKCG